MKSWGYLVNIVRRADHTLMPTCLDNTTGNGRWRSASGLRRDPISAHDVAAESV